MARAHELCDTSYAGPGTGAARLVIRAEAVNRSNPRHRMAAALGGNIRAASVELTPHDLREIETFLKDRSLRPRFPEKLEKMTGLG